MLVGSRPEEVVSKSITVSERVQKCHEEIQEGRFRKKQIWDATLTVLNEETIKLPLVKRKALAVSKQLSEMPINIRRCELLVGDMIQGHSYPFPEYATQDELAAALDRFTTTRGIPGFSCPSYSRFLTHGVSGLRRMAQEKLDRIKRLRAGGSSEEDWYESVIMALDGFRDFILRYRDLALELAAVEEDPARRDELEEIASITRNLTVRPPGTFREAVQAFWIVHVALSSTAPRSNVPVGRTDQYLWPYLKKDLYSGRTTIKQAQELLDLLWLKFSEPLQSLNVDKRDPHYDPPLPGGMTEEMFWKLPAALFGGYWGHFLGGKTTDSRDPRRYEGYGNLTQNMTLGGQAPDGVPAENPVTYLCLNATLRLGLAAPHLYVRLHDQSPPGLYERVADCLRAGLSSPALYNDEVIVPGLERQGLALEDARDYTVDGCWETYPQGRTNCKHGMISIIEALDRALCPARWYEDLEIPGYIASLDPFRDFEPANPYDFRSFEDIMWAFRDQLDRLIKGHIESVDNWRDGRLYHIAPLPFISAFMEGTLESGKDMTQDGATYNFSSPIFSGLSHAADSLAAVKKLCFEDNAIEWPEMLDAVRDNWRDREPLRRLAMTKAPAYGNDVDYTDDIAREIVEFLVEKTRQYSAVVKNRKLKFPPGLGTFGRFIGMGEITGATADGRLAGQPIGCNASPSLGRAVSGLTAALNSYCKLPLADLPSGAPLDIAMANRPGLLSQLEPFIESFVEKRGGRKEPEKYKDLVVRVGGWQAYFVDLPPEMQDWQIRKCETFADA